MHLHHGLAHFPVLPYAVVTEGTFDGLHFGHRKILDRLREITAAVRQQHGVAAQSVVLTFWPHPRLVLFPQQTDLRLLNTLPEKVEAFAQMGIDHLVVLPFDAQFAALSPEQYVNQILIQGLHTKKLVIGYDHRFGHRRQGNFDYLKAREAEFGFEVEEIPRQDIDELAVSSTRIRHALAAGHVAEAAQYLGRPYQLSGQVVRGNQLGRTLGYPTANLQLAEQHKLVPADGIYAVYAKHGDQIHRAMLYIGPRSTLGEGLDKTIEVNIFDFDKEIYGDTLTLYFVGMLRGEATFQSLEAMRAQLDKDREAALQAFTYSSATFAH